LVNTEAFRSGCEGAEPTSFSEALSLNGQFSRSPLDNPGARVDFILTRLMTGMDNRHWRLVPTHFIAVTLRITMAELGGYVPQETSSHSRGRSRLLVDTAPDRSNPKSYRINPNDEKKRCRAHPQQNFPSMHLATIEKRVSTIFKPPICGALIETVVGVTTMYYANAID